MSNIKAVRDSKDQCGLLELTERQINADHFDKNIRRYRDLWRERWRRFAHLSAPVDAAAVAVTTQRSK